MQEPTENREGANVRKAKMGEGVGLNGDKSEPVAQGRGGERMNPKCPYCPDGVEMTLRLTEYSDGTIAAAYYECPVCEADSPYIEDHIADDIRAAAYEAAMKRYVEPLRPMTFEEYAACDDAVYLELAGRFADRSRWKEPRTALSFVYFLLSDAAAGGQYGIDWRCWLRRPTDAERKAAKWEAQP